VRAGAEVPVSGGSYFIADVIPGNYSPRYTHSASGITVDAPVVTVFSGQPSATHFDLTLVAGDARGAVTINETSCAAVSVAVVDGDGQTRGEDLLEHSQFSILVPPGTYTGRVLRNAGGAPEELGTFPVTVTAGEATAESVTTADSDCDDLTDTYETLHACLDSLIPDADLDPDADTLTTTAERAAGTDPCAADSDGDSCDDGSELGDDPVEGGMRSPLTPWDFFELTGDRRIDLGDVLDVLSYFGDDGTSAAANLRDRQIVDSLQPWRTAEDNTGIDLTDALASLASFGHVCNPQP
jgi:hypothetical protein